MKVITDERVKEIIALRNNPEKKYYTLYNRWQEAEKRYREVSKDSTYSKEYQKACLSECSKAHLIFEEFCAHLVMELVEKEIDIFNL